MTWYGATTALLERWAYLPEWPQMLLRALIYRVATGEGCRRAGLPVRESPADYATTGAAVLALCRRR